MSALMEADVTLRGGRTADGTWYLEIESRETAAVYVAAERAVPVMQREPTKTHYVKVSRAGSPLCYIRWHFTDVDGRDRAGAALYEALKGGGTLPFDPPPPVA